MDKLETMELVVRFLPLADRLDKAEQADVGITLTAEELKLLTDFMDNVIAVAGVTK